MPAHALLASEWLLANGLGGYAMGTALGAPTRRYHAWLVAALRPPVGRVAALHGAVEQLVLIRPGAALGGPPVEQRIDLSTFAFEDSQGRAMLHPAGFESLAGFDPPTPGEPRCRWTYRFGEVEVVRELALVHGRNACVVRYRIAPAGHEGRLEVRPLVSLRDFHALARDDRETTPTVEICDDEASIGRGPVCLNLAWSAGEFTPGGGWWRRFVYPEERARGQDDREDLFTPGVLRAPIGAGESTLELTGWMDDAGMPRPGASLPGAVRAETRRLAAITEQVLGACPGATPRDRARLRSLVFAADQFVVRRTHAGCARGASIIAGYPWFADWGRDAMIALPGLLLTTGRFDEARGVLLAYASLQRRGLIPNCFEDAAGIPEYNSADAPLWFIHAAAAYWAATGAAPPPDDAIRLACVGVVEAYRTGTGFSIGVDPNDGLLAAGDPTTALTWMDARRDGIVFTPRHGKPVEVNALWYSALLLLAGVVEADQPRTARELRQLAERAGASFRSAFWIPEHDRLADVLSPDDAGRWVRDDRLRPNQVFAVSLPHSPLTPGQQRGVVASVREHLLTPVGLRTLDERDPGYRARYRGDLTERDRAYHNGTVWPWLLGAYADAVLRAGGGSPAALTEARGALEPLLDHLDGAIIRGQLPEVFDAEDLEREPRRPGGCPAQAWSVAEALRVLVRLCAAGEAAPAAGAPARRRRGARRG